MRKEQERAARHRLIVDTAREIAERDGWDAVTTRRLAERVGYSQPVLYSHFANREAIVAAVAVEGFAALATILGEATTLRELASSYLVFARERPALYAAMFVLPAGLPFAVPETPPELQRAFRQLVAVTGDEIRAEVLWAALHGLATLTASGRLPAGNEDQRLAVISASARA